MSSIAFNLRKNYTTWINLLHLHAKIIIKLAILSGGKLNAN